MSLDGVGEFPGKNPEIQKVATLLEAAIKDGKDVRVRVGYKGTGGEKGVVGGRVDLFDVAKSLESEDKITGVAIYVGGPKTAEQDPMWDPRSFLPMAKWFLYPGGQRSESRLVVNSLTREDLARVRGLASQKLGKSVEDKLRQIGNREELLRTKR